MGGGSKTQTTTSNSTRDPYAPTVPALQNIVTGATNAYNSGVGSQVYGGQRVAGLGSDTMAGLGQMKDAAAAGSGTAASGNSFVGGLLNNDGATAATQKAASDYSAIDPNVSTAGLASSASRLSDPNSLASTTGSALAGGAYSTDSQRLAGLANGFAGGQTQTQKSLQSVADGADLNGSPQLDALVQRSQNDAASQVAQKFAASGRYGSGRFSGAVADAVDNVGTNLRYQDLTNQQARQASAASAIDSSKNAQAGMASSLFGQTAAINQGNAGLATTGANLSQSAAQAGLLGQQALSSAQGANADRSLSQAGNLLTAAQGDRAAGLAGVAATPTVQSSLQQPGQTLAQAGAIQDAAKQQQLDSDQQVFDEQQNQPWKQLGLYSSLVDPIASLGGTTNGTETKQIPQPSTFQSILGGLSSGVGILGKTGAFGSAGAGAAAAGGASSAGWLSSALPALFAMSDERLKENIREVGNTHDGQSIYAYNFKGDPTPQIGLIAQEVAQRDPGAVGVTPAGLLAVNYDRATAPSAAMGASRAGLIQQFGGGAGR